MVSRERYLNKEEEQIKIRILEESRLGKKNKLRKHQTCQILETTLFDQLKCQVGAYSMIAFCW